MAISKWLIPLLIKIGKKSIEYGLAVWTGKEISDQLNRVDDEALIQALKTLSELQAKLGREDSMIIQKNIESIMKVETETEELKVMLLIILTAICFAFFVFTAYLMYRAISKRATKKYKQDLEKGEMLFI